MRKTKVTEPDKTAEKILKKRKFYIRFLVIFTAMLLLAFNLGSWLFLRQMGNYLEKELEKRLIAIANISTKNIDTDYIQDLTSANGRELESLLIQLALRDLIYDQEFEIESAYIIDKNQHVLIDALQNKDATTPSERTYLKQDSSAIELAWMGKITASDIHIFEGNKFKNIYAPIGNELYDDIPALLVLEANANFFEILTIFKQSLIIGGLISIGLIILFSFFISWMITLLIGTHETLRKSEKFAAMGQMAASMAHEIRNPLGIIKGTADVLKEKYGSKTEKDDLFDYISAEVLRLNHLVNNFLSFAREPKLNLKETDLFQITEKAVSAIKREDLGQNITIKITNENIPPFLFDGDAVQQVLFNMLINSIQAFEKRGDIQINIQQKTIKHKPFARLIISDNGPGIQGDADKIFEPFYSTKSTGSGLGLPISKQIIKKHGGKIEVESIENTGASFHIYLPIK